MKVKELIKILECYNDEAHVVAAVLTLNTVDCDVKREILDAWCDQVGVVNLIVTQPCSLVDPALRSENDLPEL